MFCLLSLYLQLGNPFVFLTCGTLTEPAAASPLLWPWDRRSGGKWAAVRASQPKDSAKRGWESRGLDKELSELDPGAIIGLESAGQVALGEGTPWFKLDSARRG